MCLSKLCYFYFYFLYLNEETKDRFKKLVLRRWLLYVFVQPLFPNNLSSYKQNKIQSPSCSVVTTSYRTCSSDDIQPEFSNDDDDLPHLLIRCHPQVLTWQRTTTRSHMCCSDIVMIADNNTRVCVYLGCHAKLGSPANNFMCQISFTFDMPSTSLTTYCFFPLWPNFTWAQDSSN